MNAKDNIDLGLFLIRLVIGLVFIAHGWSYLSNLGMTEAFFLNVGIPAADTMAIIVGMVEFFGGLAMILGVLTSWAGGLFSVIMLVIIFGLKSDHNLIGGYEFELVLLITSLAITFAGPGDWTMKKFFKTNS